METSDLPLWIYNYWPDSIDYSISTFQYKYLSSGSEFPQNAFGILGKLQLSADFQRSKKGIRIRIKETELCNELLNAKSRMNNCWLMFDRLGHC